MKIAKINNKHIAKEFMRFDPTFHLSESIQLKEILSVQPYELTTVGEQSKEIFFGNIFSRIFVKDENFGVSYMTASDMIKSDINSGKFIAKRQAEKLQNLIIKKDWILVSCSGTLGNVVYTNDLFENKIGTHDLIRVIPQNHTVKSGFLYAYLASKYGHTLLTQSSFGGVVKHINPEHIAHIPVPIFPQEKQEQIHNLIIEAAKLRVEANRLLEEAVEVFEKEIGVSSYQYNYRTNSINISQINTWQCRFDAQYQIAKNEIKKEKTSYSSILLKDCAIKIFTGNRNKRNYVADGIPFLSSSEMLLFNPKRFSKQISKSSKNLTDLLVCEKDILISRSGTVGNTIIVGKDLAGTTVSEHALRLVINKEIIDPEYVFCYLNTKQGKNILEATAYGSVIITLNEDYIGNINLPLLNDEIRNTIVFSINQYLEKMDKAISNENQAISLVENEIALWQS